FSRVSERDDSLGGMPLPMYAGVLDDTALHGGGLVQLAVVRGVEPGRDGLLELDPGLGREASLLVDDAPPPAIAAALGDAPGSWRSYVVSRNGGAVARVIERALPESDARLLLIGAPPVALEQAAALYAAILVGAAEVGDAGASGAAKPAE
ncbi:MAG: hypothetical protein KC486_13970, partial [Myxococcales bacterium]|nr:hypothetical protein [Myxococcales bacterium]